MLNRPAHGGNRVWAAELAQCAPHELLDFSASINPLGPPESAIAALQASIPDLCHYPDPHYTELCQALGKHHDIDPDWILPGNGVAELLTWVAWDLAQLNYTVLPVPAFGDYLRALELCNVSLRRVSLLDAVQTVGVGLKPAPTLCSVVPDGRAGLLLNNPHNPTGQSWSRQDIEHWRDRYALLVVDEAFMDFTGPEGEDQNSLIGQFEAQDNRVVLRSLTKFYSLPGLRLGYAVSHPDRLRRWQKMRDPWAVNSLAAKVGVAIVQDPAFAQATWAWLAEAKNQLYAGLQDLPGLTPLPSAANFLLVKTQVAATQLQLELLKCDRILIRDCLSFPELGEDYFRVAVRSTADNQRLLDALAVILNA
ncbi:MAG: threonine-phosphate decarboxylase CobD [Cyanobacteria bacterium P01_G01_bin.54]